MVGVGAGWRRGSLVEKLRRIFQTTLGCRVLSKTLKFSERSLRQAIFMLSRYFPDLWTIRNIRIILYSETKTWEIYGFPN